MLIGGKSSLRIVFAMILLSAVIGTGACKGQITGTVTVLDSSGPWRFLCTATAQAGGGGTVFFDLPALDPDQTAEPDYSESAFCHDGCPWEWAYQDGVLEGLMVTLPSSATGSGQVAVVEGWPIIDNIDLKMPLMSLVADSSRVTVLVGTGKVTLVLSVSDGEVAEISVTDLRGILHHHLRVNASTQPHVELPLDSGVYVIAVQYRDRYHLHKVWVH